MGGLVMGTILVEVEQWLSQRPRWLQHAAYLLIQNNNTLTEDNYRELVLLCKAETQLVDTAIKPQRVLAGSLSAKESSFHLRLDAINSIRGISALSPRNPLKFHNQLSIVYGQNGSGKSSYVRLLKHISGAKKPGKLMGNVYIQEQQEQDCSLIITKDGTNREINWTPDMGSLNELRTLQLYDTDCANVYVNDENEVAYEPYILLFFSKLTEACIKVGQALKDNMENVKVTKLIPPEGSSNTKAVLWLERIKDTTSSEEIEDNCSWSEADEVALSTKRQQLVETDPIDKMKQFKNTAQNIKKLQGILTDIRNALVDDSCTKIIEAKFDYTNKKKAAEEDAKRVFEGFPLDGVGSESWKLLWEQARIYSEQLAYPGKSYPYTEIDSNCVLCQQPLSPEAQGRLRSFESFVKDSLNKQAKSSELVESI